MSNTAWINDYLGEFAPDATDEQKTALAHAAEAADRIYPRPPADEYGDTEPDDYQTDREDTLAGAVMFILGDATLEQIGGELAVARGVAETNFHHAEGAILAAHAAGHSKLSLHRLTGVSRPHIDKILQ